MADAGVIAAHYGRADLADIILAALKAAGKDIDHLTPDDLEEPVRTLLQCPIFPVPWAREPSISHLLTAQATRQKLERAGFRVLAFEDQTADALARARARMKASGAPLALGLHIVLGQDGPTMLKNSLRNFEEGCTGLVQGIVARSG